MKPPRSIPAIFLLALAALGPLGFAMADPAPDAALVYKDKTAPVEARAQDLLRRMTLDEKIRMLGGTGFTTQPVNRLDLPGFGMGASSVGEYWDGLATAYPASNALAASFDDALSERMGVALGRDCVARGRYFLLGPGLNLYRSPLCGRNFEYYSEDPLLSGKMAAANIRGMQSQRVVATPKHYAANNQEFSRHQLSSDMDERTLRELYTRSFLIAVRDGDAKCVMASYNPINGVHASQNRHLLADILRDSIGFKGFVMSDWESCYDAVGMAQAGLDLEMPVPVQYTPEKVHALLDAKKITPEMIDNLVIRQLRVFFEMGWLDRPQLDKSIPLDDPTSAAVALDEARAGVVLLRNKDHVLPLDKAKLHKLVVIGPNANHLVTGGGGSSYTVPFHALSLVDGLKQFVGDASKVVYLDWKLGTAPTAEMQQIMHDSDAVVVNVGFDWPGVRNAGPDSRTPVPIEQYDNLPPEREGEGGDRNYELPPGSAQMITQAAAANSRTVVVLNAGGSVATVDWIEHAAGLLHAFYGGQSGATALAEIIFGQTNPSGKLPFSWEKRWEDCAAFGNYPTRANPTANTYKEGLLLGYRWFDAKNIAPLFPFGFGLSYTAFALSDFNAAKNPANGQVLFRVNVRNTGHAAGAEVVQVYVDESAASHGIRPPRELKAYGKVFLQPGEQKTLTLSLNPADLAMWDVAGQRWSPVGGTYTFQAGDSSRNLTLRTTLGL